MCLSPTLIDGGDPHTVFVLHPDRGATGASPHHVALLNGTGWKMPCSSEENLTEREVGFEVYK
jgi:hypothetical protein